MIAIDTNLLVYAHRRESSYHQQANELLCGLAEGNARWAIPWPCIYEFFSVVTNPRIWKAAASTPVEASGQVEAWIDSPALSLLSETEEFSTVLLGLMRQPRVR